MNKPAKSVVIMGIDPGSQITGVGVIRVTGSELEYVFCESIKLPKGDLCDRLKMIYSRLSEVIEAHRPEVVAIEKVFLARNPQSALTLGHARGAAMLAAVNSGLPINEYSATEIKKTVVGRGRADKAQVQHMMRVLLNLRVAPPEDAADALACAVCHSQQSRLSIAESSVQTPAQKQLAELMKAVKKNKNSHSLRGIKI